MNGDKLWIEKQGFSLNMETEQRKILGLTHKQNLKFVYKMQ